MAELLGRKAGIYLTVYQQAGTDVTFGQNVFLVFLGMAAGMAGFFLLKIKWPVFLLVWAFLLPFLMEITQYEPDTRLCLAFYMGVFLELNYIRSGGEHRLGGQNAVPGFLTGAVLMALLAAGGVGILQNLLSQADYQDSTLVTNAKEQAMEQLSQLRYGKGCNSLPDGKLKETGAWSASEDTALQVTMEQPQSLYLRGFTGSVYDGSSWKAISTEDAYEEKNLFYWLHQENFYGENQLSNARNLINDNNLSGETGRITIENKKASREYLYLPYELTELPDGYQGETCLTDSALKAEGLFGQRNYSFLSYGNLVKDFTTLGSQTFQALSNGEDNSYRKLESYYNAFVYQQDTSIPAGLESLFRRELGEGGNRDAGHTDYYTAISRIRAYLEKNMTYSTATDVFSESGDFTENFLTESKIGHSVHFATAATLMFRYYGIPARYVEGYLITPEDVQGKNPGDTIDIPGKNGHAWTEIYIDGLGWVPIEMTPSYYGVMEETDLKTGLEAKGRQAAPVQEEETPPPTVENIRTNWSLKLALFGMEKFFLLLLIVFDIFCLCFMLTILFLRVYANCQRRRKFHGKDSRIAIRAMAGYARELYAHGEETYSPETRKLYEEVKSIGQKAAFSPHPVTAKEKRTTSFCIRKMLAELKKSHSWYDKWIMKYMERLY